MKYRIATMPTFEVGGKTFGGELIRENDGSLAIMRDAETPDEDPQRVLSVPRVVRLKRGAPYDTPDPEQEAFAQKVVDLLNTRPEQEG